MTGQSALTLVERLVVTVIAALLVAFLLPALARAGGATQDTMQVQPATDRSDGQARFWLIVAPSIGRASWARQSSPPAS